eukprot:274082_1
MSSADTFNILKKQKEQVKCMLNLQCEALNSNLDAEQTEEPWKIIVYDDYCRQIIAPLFSVQELQSFGITLYLLIHHKRQQIPNVPAIYFIKPTQSNLDIVAKDMKSILYDKFYLNFSLNLERKNLEYLAKQLIATNSCHRLTKVYDQYINYTSLSPHLFTLNMTNCYQNIHAPSTSDSTQQTTVNQIVESLFCVIATLETIPIIRAQKGGAAAQIGELLAHKIAAHLKNRSSNLFETSGMTIYQNRPILIVLERSIDFAMPLHHSPIYQSLIDDLLGLKSNHVNMSDKEQIFLDHEHDAFWRQMALEPLPKVHEHHTSVLAWYQNRKDEIENNKHHNVSTTPSEDGKEDEKTPHESQHALLKSTIKSMPELLKRKDEIDRHHKLMTAVSEVLSDRAISEYFHLEEALMHSKILNTEQNRTLMNMLGIDAKGIVEDKCRLFLIYYLCHHDVKRQTLNDLIDTLLSNDNIDAYLCEDSVNKLAALKYIADHKRYLNLADSLTDNDEQKEKQEDATNRMSSWWESGQSILNKVKGMLPTSGKCTVTRIAKLLMNTDSTSLANVAYSSVNTLSQNQHLRNVNKNYLTFDPMDNGNGSDLDKVNYQEYQRGIVFMVGGGCFAEYANLNEFANNKHKNIIYGCTDIVSPNDFLTQLTNLGQQPI